MRKIFLIFIVFVFSGCGGNAAAELAQPTAPPISKPPMVDEYTVTDIFDEALPVEEEIPPVYLEMTDTAYSLASDDYLPYVIINNTGKSINVLFIPTLEKKNADVWEITPTVGVGFCGTPDSVGETHSGSVPLEWYADSLTPGLYRLSFTIADDGYNDVAELVSNTFMLD